MDWQTFAKAPVLAALWASLALSAVGQEFVADCTDAGADCESFEGCEPTLDSICCEDTGPFIWARVGVLVTRREAVSLSNRPVIGGADAQSFDSLGTQPYDAGYRIQGGLHYGNFLYEMSYSRYGTWDTTQTQSVDGVAFDVGTNNEWLGRNFINAGTYFSPVFDAASFTGGPDSTDENDGLGPNDAFGDTNPVVRLDYQSTFYTIEANVKYARPVFGSSREGMRFGVGYVNANLNELARASLSGTFRAADVAAADGGLQDGALTDPNGGNLALLSGGATGFEDETVAGTPSELLFTHSANTTNNLNGVQLLLEGTLFEMNRFSATAGFKAGICHNQMAGSIREVYAETNNDLSTYGRSFNDSTNGVSFLGGLTLGTGYHLTEHVTVRGGYSVMYVTGVALSPEQALGIQNGFYNVQSSGDLLVHGGNIGLEYAY